MKKKTEPNMGSIWPEATIDELREFARRLLEQESPNILIIIMPKLNFIQVDGVK